MVQKSLFLLSFLILPLNGYIFNCVDNCECDTDDEGIHCHNNQKRERLQLPENKLRGFTVIGLTKNNIKVLPSEELLLSTFPDLVAIDVEGNVNFDCSTLPQYKNIAVMSDCGKDPEKVRLRNGSTDGGVGTTSEPTTECDIECQTKRHYKNLHEYIINLWKMIKEKMKNLSKDNRFFKDIENFFSKIGDTLSNINFKLK